MKASDLRLGRAMSTFVLLITLSQFQGLSMWTDSSGVVHVAASTQAPRNATSLEGGNYSVIDNDGRPKVMPDGGSREDDSAWWKERFEQARQAVSASRALEAAALRDVSEAEREVCVTARAEAVASVVAGAGTRVVVINGVKVVTPAQRQGLAAARVEERTVTETRNCAHGQPTSAMREAVVRRREEREQAEFALRRLETQALAEHVPLRDWY